MSGRERAAAGAREGMESDEENLTPSVLIHRRGRWSDE